MAEMWTLNLRVIVLEYLRVEVETCINISLQAPSHTQNTIIIKYMALPEREHQNEIKFTLKCDIFEDFVLTPNDETIVGKVSSHQIEVGLRLYFSVGADTYACHPGDHNH